MKIGRYAIGPTPRDCPCTSAHAMGRKPEAGARVNHRRCPTNGAACTGTYLRPALRRGIRSSGLDTADDAALDVRCWPLDDLVISSDVRFAPILLQKDFWGDERQISGTLTRVARGDVRDHVVPRKNDHGPAERRDDASQRYSSLKITFREIFGGV